MPVLWISLDGALDLHLFNCSEWGLRCFWVITFVVGCWPVPFAVTALGGVPHPKRGQHCSQSSDIRRSAAPHPEPELLSNSWQVPVAAGSSLTHLNPLLYVTAHRTLPYPLSLSKKPPEISSHDTDGFKYCLIIWWTETIWWTGIIGIMRRC